MIFRQTNLSKVLIDPFPHCKYQPAYDQYANNRKYIEQEKYNQIILTIDAQQICSLQIHIQKQATRSGNTFSLTTQQNSRGRNYREGGQKRY